MHFALGKEGWQLQAPGGSGRAPFSVVISPSALRSVSTLAKASPLTVCKVSDPGMPWSQEATGV